MSYMDAPFTTFYDVDDFARQVGRAYAAGDDALARTISPDVQRLPAGIRDLAHGQVDQYGNLLLNEMPATHINNLSNDDRISLTRTIHLSLALGWLLVGRHKSSEGATDSPDVLEARGQREEAAAYFDRAKQELRGAGLADNMVRLGELACAAARNAASLNLSAKEKRWLGLRGYVRRTLIWQSIRHPLSAAPRDDLKKVNVLIAKYGYKRGDAGSAIASIRARP